MKFYTPKNSIWYIAVIFLFGPFVALRFFEQAWTVRFVGASSVFLGVGFLSLWTGIFHKINLADTPFNKKYGKGKIILIFRTVFIIFGFAVVMWLLPLIIKDVAAIIKKNAPITIIALAESTRVRALTGLITEEVKITNHKKPFEAWYFPPRQIMQGNTYEFLYLPNTRWIVEARLIKEGK